MNKETTIFRKMKEKLDQKEKDAENKYQHSQTEIAKKTIEKEVLFLAPKIN